LIGHRLANMAETSAPCFGALTESMRDAMVRKPTAGIAVAGIPVKTEFPVRVRGKLVPWLAQTFGRASVLLVLATAVLAPNAVLVTNADLRAQSNSQPGTQPGASGTPRSSPSAAIASPPPLGQPTAVPEAWTGIGPIDDALAGIGNWVDRANREYRDIVNRELSVPTEAAIEAERRRKLAEPAKTPSPQIARPVEPANSAETKPTETAAAPPADEATRARQRAAEVARIAQEARTTQESRAKASATNGPVPTGPTVAAAPPVPAPPLAAAGPNEPKIDQARRDAERKEADRVAAQKREAELKAIEKREAAEKRDADRREAERKNLERKEAERIAADNRETARKAAEAKTAAAAVPPATTAAPSTPAPNTASPSPAAVADRKPPSPGELATEASKAGTAISRRLDGESTTQSKTTGTSSDRADGSAGGDRRQLTRTASSGSGGRCKAAGRKIEPPGTYVVKRGDNLWRISRRHYDRGARYMQIVRANASKIADPDLIFPCQRFFLPVSRRADALIDLPREIFAGVGGIKPNTWPVPVTSSSGTSMTESWPPGPMPSGLVSARFVGGEAVRP